MDVLGGDLLPREGVHLSLQVLQPLSAHGSCGVTWGSTSHLQISEGLTLSCNQWSGGSDLWAGRPGRAHGDAGCAGSHCAGKCSAAGQATGEPQPAVLISQPVQPRCRACDELVVTPAPGLESP